MRLFVFSAAFFVIILSAEARAASCSDTPTARNSGACAEKQPAASNNQDSKVMKKTDKNDKMVNRNKFLDEEEARMKKILKPICQHC